jgi:hypothetical protein
MSQRASPSPVSTWNVLCAIGFAEIDGRRLCFDFGNFQLEAVQGITELAVPVVQIGGVLSASNRTIAMVSHHLPSELESQEQGLAFLTDYLRRHVRHLRSRSSLLSPCPMPASSALSDGETTRTMVVAIVPVIGQSS